MKTIILAAGYGTRLYPLTLNKPKALLDVGGKTILERVLEKVFELQDCDAIYIVSNEKFYKSLADWVKGISAKVKIEVFDDGTTSNEDRLGAIGDINFVVKKAKINDDCLVLGSDNIFDFDLKNFIKFAKSKSPHASLALFDIKNIEKASLYGIAVMKEKGEEVIDFQEKPKEPKSTLAATAIYYYPKEKVSLLEEYMKGAMTKDAPGNFIKWLRLSEAVYGYVFRENWYDIGDKESLKQADEEFKRRGK